MYHLQEKFYMENRERDQQTSLFTIKYLAVLRK